MTRRNSRLSVLALVAGALSIAVTNDALAYIGPGAGLASIGSLVVVVGVIFLALLGLVVFPLQILMKRRRNSDKTQD